MTRRPAFAALACGPLRNAPATLNSRRAERKCDFRPALTKAACKEATMAESRNITQSVNETIGFPGTAHND
jgi:hypothetical protein